MLQTSALALCLATTILPARAASNIDSVLSFAWSENDGWINFFSQGAEVQVTDTLVTGYAWGQNIGWINLQPPAAGIHNNGAGVLSGQAWGEHTGYIDFSGVSIDGNGYFHGMAMGAITGQISFNCDNTASCSAQNFAVRTTWRPSASAPITAPVYTGGGGGAPTPVLPPASTARPTRPAAPDQIPEASVCKAITPDSLWQTTLQCDGDCLARPLSRAAFLELLFPAACTADTLPVPIFRDVPATHPNFTAVQQAALLGIVQGYGDHQFRPYQPIRTAEVVKILLRYFMMTPAGTYDQNHTPEAKTSAWYQPYMDALQSKVTTGDAFTARLLQPDYLPTRKEIAWFVLALEK